MKVLLTRPQYDSEELARDLLREDIHSHIDPLLEVKLNPFQEDLQSAQGLIITSLNGIRCFAAQNPERSLPLFVVGQESAKLASLLNFKKVIVGEGTALSLIPLIQKFCPLPNKKIVYITGDYIHTDLKKYLIEMGYSTQRIIAYMRFESSIFSSQTQSFFENKVISAIPLFSPRSAQIFAKLIESNKDHCRSLNGICLSQEVAKNVSHLPWKKLYTTVSPTRQDVFTILRALKKEGIL